MSKYLNLLWLTIKDCPCIVHIVSAETFVRRTWIEAPAAEVFRWHAEPGALARLTPPWERVEILEEGALKDGAEVELRVRVGPLSLPWVSRIEEVVPGRSFRDVQVRGPFARWEHTHCMEAAGPGVLAGGPHRLRAALRGVGEVAGRPSRPLASGADVRVSARGDPGGLRRLAGHPLVCGCGSFVGAGIWGAFAWHLEG